MRWQIKDYILDFGPLSLVIQNLNNSHVTTFNYTQEERYALSDWLYWYAIEDEAPEPHIFSLADARWQIVKSEYDGICISGINDKRCLDLYYFKQDDAGNLANALREDLAFTPNEYQRQTKRTATYYDMATPELSYLGLGLAGEAGEVANEIKKIDRDDEGGLTVERSEKILDEVGDALWYCARLLDECGYTLEEAMYANLQKLQQRYGGS